jgi:hypothetical protein
VFKKRVDKVIDYRGLAIKQARCYDLAGDYNAVGIQFTGPLWAQLLIGLERKNYVRNFWHCLIVYSLA